MVPFMVFRYKKMGLCTVLPVFSNYWPKMSRRFFFLISPNRMPLSRCRRIECMDVAINGARLLLRIPKANNLNFSLQ